MAIFVVFALSNPQAVYDAANEKFRHDHFKLSSDQMLISANMTAKELSDALFLSEGENGNGIVFKMSSYFGRYSVAVWDWIKTKAEQPNG